MKWLISSSLSDEADRRYARWLAGAGIEAEWIRPGETAPGLDALLLTGGGDVDPSLYGAERHARTDLVNRARDEFEVALIRQFMERRRPVFGICRGIQVLNVAAGGRLIQHISDALPVPVSESHEQVAGRDVNHLVSLTAGSRLAPVLAPEIEVNSAHHQAVDPAALGRGLRIAARSPAGIVEAMEGEGIPALAVQWHPERLPPDHPASRRLLDLFVSMTK